MLMDQIQNIELRINGDKLAYESQEHVTDETIIFMKKHKNELMSEVRLMNLLNLACKGLDTDPKEVIRLLLSEINIFDISAGGIPVECLIAHIRLWIVEGKQKIN